MGDGIPTSYKGTYRHLKRSYLGCLETPFSDYPLTQCLIPEERNHHERGLRKPFKLALKTQIRVVVNAGRGELKVAVGWAAVVKHSCRDI